jgi:osmotically-inducible protein OsmY
MNMNMNKSDSQLQKDIIEELKWEPSVNETNIGVEVKDGIVTIAGHVDSYAEKLHAEKAALRVSGVRAVAVEIDVKLQSHAKRTDGDIALAVKNMLDWNVFLPKDSIKVMVENGWVTLTGIVNSDYQRMTASLSIRYLTGVTGVSNEVAIKPKVSVSTVKSDIEATLKRRALEDASSIHVEVHDHDVTLSGTAHSLAELQLVRVAARNSPGVSKVKDNMRLTFA